MRDPRTINLALGVAIVFAFDLATAQTVIEDVVVTATRLPRSVQDIAGTVSVISDAELERQVADDLDDLVRYQPGVSMDTAQRGGNQGFVIRGIGGNRVLTVVDGVRSTDQYAAGPSSYGKDAYELDDIRSVEIIRGPASALYGADAMGGTVLIHTKTAADYLDEGETSALAARIGGASADEQRRVGLSGVVQGRSWGTLAQFTERRFQEHERGGDAATDPLDGRSHGLLSKTNVQIGEHSDLTFGVDAFAEDIDLTLDSELGTDVFESQGLDETDRVRISVAHRWQGDHSLANSLDSQVYSQTSSGLQHTRQRRTSYSFIDPANPATYAGTEVTRVTDFYFDQDTVGANVTATKILDSAGSESTLIYGLSIEQTDTQRPRHRCETEISSGASTCSIAAYPFAEPEVFPNRTFPDTTTERAGLFAQGEVAAGDSGRLTLIPGIRYDRYEMDPKSTADLDIDNLGFEISPVSEDNWSANLGLIFDINDNLALVAQYSQGFRPPNFDESNQAFVNRAFGYATVPNPDLRPETSDGIEIGLKAESAQARFSAALYRNDYKNFISSELVGVADGISLFQDRNIGEAQIEGVELMARWILSERWQIHGGFAYSRGTDTATLAPLDSVDPLTGVLGLRFERPDGRIGVETALTAVAAKTRVSAADRVTADAYQLLDVFGHYRLSEEVTLRLGVYNLSDETYARWANLQGLAASDSDAVSRVSAPGRNFRAGLQVNF
jgi:hemoglobin/transferrin/lactoferrin receptor protein